MSGSPRRAGVRLALALLVVLAGCSGAGSDGGGGGDRVASGGGNGYTEAAAETGAAADSGSGGGGGSYQDQQLAVKFTRRQLILTGEVSIEVDSFDRASRNLTRAARRYGGFVSDSHQEVHTRDNQTWTTGRIVFRVPRENFSAFLDRAKNAGELQRANTNTEDVTDQLVDIGARLKSLRAQRERLRELYDRANDTESLLQVQERLSEVQTEIERLEARQQSLRRQVAYSTVTVQLSEPRPERERPLRTDWYDVGVVAAFLESVDGVVVALRAIVVGIAYVLPYLLVFGAPVVGLAYAIRRRRG